MFIAGGTSERPSGVISQNGDQIKLHDLDEHCTGFVHFM